MKKILCSGLILSFTVFVFAQRGSIIPKTLRDYSRQVKEPVMIDELGTFENIIKPTACTNAAIDDLETIGITLWDLQSNQTVGSSRIHVFDDGTISAVWTMGFAGSDPWADKGTGYNYFDGTSWGPLPTERIENVKTGWPNIAKYGPDGEINVAHTGQAQGLYFSHRPTKGSGTWENFFLTGPDTANILLWPRMITAGDNHNIIHVICPGGSTYAGQNPALLYSRSTDGIVWNPQNIVLSGTGYEYYTGISADEYCWAEPVNGILAFLVTDPFHDWFAMKSYDGGDNWEKIMIWEHPYPFFSLDTTFTIDTLWAPDGSGDIALDILGKIHTVCGLTRIARFPGTPQGNFTYFPATDGICYWNEDMPAFTNPNQHDALDAYDVLVEDVNLIGWIQDIDGNGIIELVDNIMVYRTYSLTTMPTITISPNNSIYVAWAGTSECYVGTVGSDEYNYKHVWTRAYQFGVWGDFEDINSNLTTTTEYIYPVYAKDMNDKLHLIFNEDFTPGLGVEGDHPFQENKTQYWTDMLTSINTNENSPSGVEVSQNYPNPATGTSYVEVKLKEATTLRLEVTNMIGQVVYEINKGKVNAGTQVLKLDVSGLIPGVYFYTVYADKASVTHKMVIE